MMDPKIKKAWIKALRSGKYKQAAGQFKTSEGFCCLGVLCDITGREWTKHNKRGYFPPQVRQSGVTQHKAEWLAHINDSGKEFSEIADWIEENL